LTLHRSLLALALLALTCLPALARPAEDEGSERARLRRQQHELEAQHAQRLAECAQRFEVNKCRQKATGDFKAGLQPLLERERILDEEARTHRALMQSLRTSVRQGDEAASGPAVRAAAHAASRTASEQRSARSKEKDDKAARKAAQLQADEQQAAERQRQARQRQLALEAHAKAVHERNARRDTKPAAGLPIPSAASIAALPAASRASP